MLLRFRNSADFKLDTALSAIEAYRHSATPPTMLRHLLIDQVVPRALGQQGQIVIHASAVRVAGGCVAFLGASGLGKSTLAASFLSAGFELLADDALKFIAGPQGVMAISAYPGLRLRLSSERVLSDAVRRSGIALGAAGKQRYAVGRPQDPTTPEKLLGVFTLEPDCGWGAPGIRECTGAESVADLMRVAFSLNPRNGAHQVAQFHALSSIVDSGPRCFRLSFARHFDMLPRVRAAVLAAIAGLR